MPGLLVSKPERNELNAHISTYNRNDGGLKLNSSHNTPLPPSESLTLLRFTSVASGSGVAVIKQAGARRWQPKNAGSGASKESGFSPAPAPSGCGKPR